MSLECTYKDIDRCKSAFYKSDDCMCDTSIIVPDSMSDIIKIVSVKATPLITQTKAVSGRIEITGQVRFNVIYISENENCRIASLCSNAEFSHFISSSDINENSVVIVHGECVNESFTMLNSRKIKVGALLRFFADTYSVSRSKVLTNAEGCEMKHSEITLPSYKVICSKNIVVSATSDIPAGKNAINSILKQNVSILDSDYKILNNKIVVKGNLSLNVLYDGDGLQSASVNTPFTEIAEIEGLSPSLEAYVNITVADWDIKPDTDLSGDYKMLDSTVVLNINVLAYTPQQISYVSDMFLPHSSLNYEQVTIDALCDNTCFSEEEFVKDAITLSPQSPPIVKVLDFDAKLCDVTLSNDSVTLTAEISVIYQTDESSQITSYSAKIPVTHRISSDIPQRVKAAIKHSGYAILSDNALDVRLSILFDMYRNKTTDFTHYTFCEETESTLEKRPSILVSCVGSNDTLWSLAKKYNIPLAHLALSNAIDENSNLTVGEKLIIPR